MKNKKYSNASSYEYYEEDDNENYNRNAKKKRLEHSERRRPLKNYKKAWSQHETDPESRDEFYSK